MCEGQGHAGSTPATSTILNDREPAGAERCSRVFCGWRGRRRELSGVPAQRSPARVSSAPEFRTFTMRRLLGVFANRRVLPGCYSLTNLG